MPRGNPPRRKDDAAGPAPSRKSRQRGVARRAAWASMDSIRLGRDDELVLDADEHVVEAGAEQAGADDDGNANQGSDEAVFDGGRARLFSGKAGQKGFHGSRFLNARFRTNLVALPRLDVADQVRPADPPASTPPGARWPPQSTPRRRGRG